MTQEAQKDVFSKLLDKRCIFLYQEIDAELSSKLVADLLYLDSISSEEITLYINAPGGTVQDGLFAIYDTMRYIKSPIKTIACGKAYSAAAVILCAGTKGKRFAFPNAEIMIHPVWTEIIGYSQPELEKEIIRSKRTNESMLKIISKHTGKSLAKINKDVMEDRYFTAEQAITYGLIDQICSSK